MITCPICKELVKDPIDQKNVADGYTKDFYCPTYVHVAEGRRWGHYNRHLDTLADGIVLHTIYTAIVPPFKIEWTDELDLRVDRFTFLDKTANSIRYERICTYTQADFEEFLRFIPRFQKLRLFS